MANRGELSWNAATSRRSKSPNPLRALVYSPDEEILNISESELASSMENSAGDDDQFHNQFQSARRTFETWQPRQKARPRSPPRSSVSADLELEGGVDETSVGEARIEPFPSLKKRFQGKDANNNTSPPRSMKYTAATPPSRLSWDGNSSTPSSSRRSSESSSEYNDRQRRASEIASEMAAIRERIAVAKTELTEAKNRHEIAERGYDDAKRRIGICKQQSKSLRDQMRSTENQIEWKEKKFKEAKRKLETVTMRIEQNDRTAAFYDKDIRKESALIEEVSEKLEATRVRRQATKEKIRGVAPRLPPLKKAITAAEVRAEKARDRSRRFQDILNKTTIKLRNRQVLSSQAARRVSFKGYAIEDARKVVNEEKDRAKRARSNVGYLEYRRQLLREQIEEYQRDLRGIVIRLNPHLQQKAFGFQYTRLPMSEEL